MSNWNFWIAKENNHDCLGFIIYYMHPACLCVCMCVHAHPCMCHCMCVETSGQLARITTPFHHVGPVDQMKSLGLVASTFTHWTILVVLVLFLSYKFLSPWLHSRYSYFIFPVLVMELRAPWGSLSYCDRYSYLIPLSRDTIYKHTTIQKNNDMHSSKHWLAIVL